MDLKAGVAEGHIGLIIGVENLFFVAIHAYSFAGWGTLEDVFSEAFRAVA